MIRCILNSLSVSLLLVFLLPALQVYGQDETKGVPLPCDVDHVVATIASKKYAAVDRFLNERFPNSWKREGDTKGFLLCSANEAYAEIWNSGVWYQYGYQVAFSSPKSPDAPERAERRFGVSGVSWTEAIFTVGSHGAVGHPIAGTFLVHPGGSQSQQSEAAELANFDMLITTMPECRLTEKETYGWFGLAVAEHEQGFSATDSRGFNVQVRQISDQSVLEQGHVAFGFRLTDPVDAREEIVIPESGGTKAILDGDRFWLVFQPALFEDEE